MRLVHQLAVELDVGELVVDLLITKLRWKKLLRDWVGLRLINMRANSSFNKMDRHPAVMSELRSNPAKDGDHKSWGVDLREMRSSAPWLNMLMPKMLWETAIFALHVGNLCHLATVGQPAAPLRS